MPSAPPASAAGTWTAATNFPSRAARRRAAIDRFLWDARAGAYFDFDWTHRERIRRLSAATLYPLFVGLASSAEAASVAEVAARELLKAGGIVATPLVTGQQWDAPNGWAPLQWIAIDGLRHYDQDRSQQRLRAAGCEMYKMSISKAANCSRNTMWSLRVARGGGGEYPLQDGFGWTNGVMRKLISLYPEDARTNCAGRLD